MAKGGRMTTVQFWQGFMLGAALNAALTIAFMKWQDYQGRP
jgi:hypothetical protein